MEFRQVKLSDGVTGQLYLHSMPGRYDPLEESWEQVHRLGIRTIVCLAPDTEVRKTSPGYATALEAGECPCEIWSLPIPDFGAPPDDAFARMTRRAATALREGDSLLVHCGAGIGRTGTFAIGVLLALGVDFGTATILVRKAGSGPEQTCQVDALKRLKDRELNGD